ncbi:MAG: hypothetical protein WBP41_11880 [Saprospiraceae bacterium]
MIDVDIKNLAREIEVITNRNGYNYEITLGFDWFKNCPSLKHFQDALKAAYNEINADELKMTTALADDFWYTVNHTFDYRGGQGSGLKFENNDEVILKSKQDEYKAYLNQLINKDSHFYTFQELKGIPGYPVRWSYRYIIDNGNGDYLLIFGSASD